MTKKQLIEALQFVNDDEEIYVEVDFGDHWQTSLAKPVLDVGEMEMDSYTAKGEHNA